jgi:hypothetical protein
MAVAADRKFRMFIDGDYAERSSQRYRQELSRMSIGACGGAGRLRRVVADHAR